MAASDRRFYCVSFTIRSGSTLLCEDLTQVGLGAPTEQFQFPEAPVLDGPLWDHIARLAESGDGPYFGFKAAWYQVAEVASRLRAEGLDHVDFGLRGVFPGLRHIHLSRRDKVGQAVSAWRARTTGTWHWPVGTHSALAYPEYDFPAILLQFRRLLAEEWLWQSTFDQLGILPLHIDYEDYVEDRAGHLRRIADFLDEPVELQPLHDRLTVMADDWTTAVVERFTTDLHRPEERDPVDRRSARPVPNRRRPVSAWSAWRRQP
jgi:LPS sulfotransferase NodH